jgi:hypothetical protein
MKLKFKFENRKGELSTQQIVLLLILIISFIIILLFLFRLNPGDESKKEACHQSVVLRGNSVIPADAVPLKCEINYLCITKDGTCEGITTKNVEKVKTEEEIYDVLANEMADCWWMFGEGDLNYVGKDLKENLYCSICTQFILDNSLNEIEGINGEIDESRFYQYLGAKEYSDKDMSYLQYITSANSFGSLESSISSEGGSFGSYELGKQYFVMMGMYSDVGIAGWIAAGTGLGVAIVLVPFLPGGGITLASAIVMTLSTGGGAIAGTVVKGASGESYLTPVIIRANSDEFKVFKCKDVMTIA